MTYPGLTFISPSILTDDKSLVYLLSHEISHSWTGLLVTPANWQNLWLSEGFTVFLQRKVSQIIYGEDIANIEAKNGYNAYLEDINNYGTNNTYTSLLPQFGESDPDDYAYAFSEVPYEKGFNFLYYLETLVNKTNFQIILKEYINAFKFQSIDYLNFKDLFEKQVRILFTDEEKANTIINTVDWNSWILSPGLPVVKNAFRKLK